MKRIFLILAVLSVLCPVFAAHTVRAVFNWADPSSLSPAFPAPNASNRYGEYISKVNFTADGVTLFIDDDAVKESSQKARFLYGYVTQCVEMRAYAGSDIVIEAPENMTVTRVQFEGAKADENYLTSYDAASTWSGQEWTPSTSASAARFYVAATINCTRITVVCTEDAGVEAVEADARAAEETWYNLQGVRLDKMPIAPGVYVRSKGAKACKMIVR